MLLCLGLWPIGMSCMVWSLTLHLILVPLHCCCASEYLYRPL